MITWMILTGFVTFQVETLREQQIHYSITPTSERIYGTLNMPPHVHGVTAQAGRNLPKETTVIFKTYLL